MNEIESAIIKLNGRLSGMPFDFAFLGGSVLSLLITDADVDAIRVTKDVDVMMKGQGEVVGWMERCTHRGRFVIPFLYG